MKLDIQPPNYVYCPFCSKKLGSKVEEEKVRKFCSDCKWIYYPNVAAAACAVIVKDKKVLMVRRNREPYKGTWMFPAGFVDFGEHPMDTVIREVKEEVGLEVTNLSLLEVLQVDDDPRSMGHLGFFYRVEVKDGEIKNKDTDENSEIAWFNSTDLPLVGWHGHKQIIEKYF